MVEDPITTFYQQHLPRGERKNNLMTVACPFCRADGERGILTVFLNPTGPFHGYFRCSRRCVPGGFALHFARLASLPLAEVPGYDPDREDEDRVGEYPVGNINQEIDGFMERMTPELRDRFAATGIGPEVLAEMRVGFNGRYLVYPYIQEDGNCYSARCVHPERPDDTFWYGDENFSGASELFNRLDIRYCENGALIITVGEENLLALRQLGLPCVAAPSLAGLEGIDGNRLRWLRTIFLFVRHSRDARAACRRLAERLGYKVRIVRWPEETPRNMEPVQLARTAGESFQKEVLEMLRAARSFSPFGSPEREYLFFANALAEEKSGAAGGMRSGFPLLDEALAGIRGITIMGGTPKAGKSCFFIQIATEMARRRIPVIYYDFENGRQKIYLRTVSRLSRISSERIRTGQLDREEEGRLGRARADLRGMLAYFRVVTDRRLDPVLMRRHIDFLQHETGSSQVLVVIDSLHKLPFKDLSERRTGIDGWLRELEAIRDGLGVSFLVISELSRGREGQYDEQPHMGSFKGSGDIEYSADNAMILRPRWDPFDRRSPEQRRNELWLVASRERTPGLVAVYRLDFPYWGFVEETEAR